MCLVEVKYRSWFFVEMGVLFYFFFYVDVVDLNKDYLIICIFVILIIVYKF